MSLRSRIALVAALLVLAAVAVSTVVQTLAARRAILEQARAGGDGIATMLARVAAFAEDVPPACSAVAVGCSGTKVMAPAHSPPMALSKAKSF